MSYIEGFVAAVPRANKDAYRKHASAALPMFKRLGATRMVENWGDDVPDGKVTDFRRSVKAQPEEDVIFSWLEYPDKATRDRANETMMNDPAMKDMGKSMPFDGQRMIWGGFSPINDTGATAKPGYIDGCVIPVPAANLDAYREMAENAGRIWKDHGAIDYVECIAEDVKPGKVTSFPQAVKLEPDETVIFSWITYKSREDRDRVNAAVMKDPRLCMDPAKMPFDGQRMFWGGFEKFVEL